jgi:uncharacterized protein YecT (DUF1311 family)
MFRSAIAVLVAAVVVGPLQGSGALGAEITVDASVQNVTFIDFKGEIEPGDAAKFYDAVANLKGPAVVMLQGPGGLLSEALKIAAEVRRREFSTLVAGDTGCYSACGLVWVSGRRRYMSPASRIGFHAAFRKEGDGYLESGVANAEIGSYLTHLGLRIEAIRFFTLAGPRDMLLLSPELARVLGVDVYVLGEGGRIVSPIDAPTVDTYARRWMGYNILRMRCRSFLQPDSSVLDAGVKQAFEGGNQLVGGEQWVNLWLQLLEDTKDRIAQGLLLHCIEIERELRGQRLATGINGPSFDCTKASTPTEIAICEDQDLWPKDRAMNAIYVWIRGNVEPAIRRKILAVQRAWLSVRNACGADRQCLNRVYDQRLQELRTINIAS